VATRERRTFPLVPRRPTAGLPFGDLPSRRRGRGSELIGTRAYQVGDPFTSIDWFASARASAASGGDEFIVREHAADEAARVVVVVDRRPAMDLYPAPLPWLSKREALSEAVAAITASASVARADLAALDFGDGDAYWLPPGRRERHWQIAEREAATTPFDAPEDSVARSLAFLEQHRVVLPRATFVFVLSDFLAPPTAEAWQHAAANGWDLVAVVIQDPTWERSFPAVGGVALPVRDPRSGSVELVRLSAREARQRREAHARRYADLHAELASFGVGVVEIGESDPAAVDAAFIAWAEERRRQRWGQ
jgi:uncharacterized protein (DUF58 family)